MQDALKRAARTAAQAFVGMLALLAVPQLTEIVRSVSSGDDYQLDFSTWQSIGIACCAAVLISLVSFVQNALEDKTGKTALK